MGGNEGLEYRWKKEWKEGEGREGEVKEVRGKRTERVFWERDRETGTEREREQAKQKQGRRSRERQDGKK